MWLALRSIKSINVDFFNQICSSMDLFNFVYLQKGFDKKYVNKKEREQTFTGLLSVDIAGVDRSRWK